MGYEVTITKHAGSSVADMRAHLKAMSGQAYHAGVCGPEGASAFIDRRTGQPTGLSVAGMAFTHEQGLGVPERPFMATTLAQQLPTLRKRGRDVGIEMLSLNGDAGLRAVAVEFAEEVRALLMGGMDLEALSPRTLAAPDRDSRGIPLVDTMQIHDSIQAVKA